MFGTTPQSISSIHRLLSPQAGRRGRPQQRKEGELQEVHDCSSSMQVGVNDAACSCESTTSGGLNRPPAPPIRHPSSSSTWPPNQPSTSSLNSSSYKPSRSTGAGGNQNWTTRRPDLSQLLVWKLIQFHFGSVFKSNQITSVVWFDPRASKQLVWCGFGSGLRPLADFGEQTIGGISWGWIQTGPHIQIWGHFAATDI